MKILFKIVLIVLGAIMILFDIDILIGFVLVIIAFTIKRKKTTSTRGYDPDEQYRKQQQRARKRAKADFKREIRREEKALLDLRATIDGRSSAYGCLDLAGKVELKALEMEYRKREAELRRQKQELRRM